MNRILLLSSIVIRASEAVSAIMRYRLSVSGSLVLSLNPHFLRQAASRFIVPVKTVDSPLRSYLEFQSESTRVRGSQTMKE